MNPTDAEALIESLFNEHHARVLNYAFRLTGNREEAEDAAGQVFLSLAVQLRGGERPANPLAWLYRCTANRVTSVKRKALVRSGNLGDVWRWIVGQSTPSTPDPLPEVRNAMARLKATDREVITLVYDEELDMSVIAQILGLEESSARSRLSRALERLRGEMKGHSHE